MHAYEYSWLQNNQLLGPFVCIMFLCRLTIPFIGTNYILRIYFWRVKATDKTTALLTCFSYNMIFVLINNLIFYYLKIKHCDYNLYSGYIIERN